MKERPILFKPEMVNAILDGRKTQTRRIVKPQPIGLSSFWPNSDACIEWQDVLDDIDYYIACGHCPYGRPVDRLWVREPWARVGEDGTLSGYIRYKADELKAIGAYGSQKWKPSIHMPRGVSRITLEIAKIRAERVQDITEEDAKAEGVWGIDEPYQGVGDIPTDRFRALWDKINGNWNDNPFVWVIEFKRL